MRYRLGAVDMASGEAGNAQAVISIGFVLARFDSRKDFSFSVLR
jgi:hypothetical protein